MTKEKGRLGRYAGLSCCGGGFLAGALTGCLLAGLTGRTSQAALTDFLAGYGVALLGGAGVPGLGALLWNAVRWPLMVFLLGFTGLGVAVVPIVLALRGFFLSYCVAALVRALAGRGAVLALVLFGVEGLFTLPVLFALGLSSWEAARALGGRLIYTRACPSPYGAGYWPRCLLCFLLLTLGTLAESVALPPLLGAVAPFFAGG